MHSRANLPIERRDLTVKQTPPYAAIASEMHVYGPHAMVGAWTLQLVYHELRNAYHELRVFPPFCVPLRVGIM